MVESLKYPIVPDREDGLDVCETCWYQDGLITWNDKQHKFYCWNRKTNTDSAE